MRINAINCYNNNYANNKNFKARFTMSDIKILADDAMKSQKYEMVAYPKLYTLLEFLYGFKQKMAKLTQGKRYSTIWTEDLYHRQISIGDCFYDTSAMSEDEYIDKLPELIRLSNNTYTIGEQRILKHMPNSYELLYNTCVCTETPLAEDPIICRMPQHVFQDKLYDNRGKTYADLLELALENAKRVVI